MRLDPVLIFMQPRSGSSFTAEIFHRHGLWVGRLPATGRYQTWENEDIRLPIKRFCGQPGDSPLELRELLPQRTPQDVYNLFARVVPDGTHWLYKCPIDRYPVVRPVFPEARIVFVRRSTESVVRSLLDKISKHKRSEAQLREHVRARHAFVDGLAMEYGYPVIRTQRVIDGDLSTLQNAMRHCGLEMNVDIVNQVIDRSQWHF